MRHLLKFCSLHFEQHFILCMQSHTLNLEGRAETVFLIPIISQFCSGKNFHANQNVLKKWLKILSCNKRITQLLHHSF